MPWEVRAPGEEDTEEKQKWLLGSELSNRVDGRAICQGGDKWGTSRLGHGTSLGESGETPKPR